MHRLALTHLFVVLALLGCVAVRPLPRPAPGVRCLRTEQLFEDPVAEGQELATPELQRTWKLAAFDSADVTLVEDPIVCGRVSRTLGVVPPGPVIAGRRRPIYSDVVVVRLGRAGYLVHSYWHISHAGEFLCATALMDSRFRETKWLCG